MATPDIAILSLGTTMGWRQADEALATMLERAGVSCELVAMQIGWTGRLRKSMAMTDLVEAVAARRTAAGISARAIIYSSITAALLQRPRVPFAVRFDTVAALSRPGINGVWQRRREPSVLANARLLLPLSDTAARTAEGLIERRKRATAPASITLPIPLERLPGAAVRDLDAVAYAANPAKRGLDLLCQAWRLARPADGVLLVSGIDRERALRWLSGIGVDEPPGIQWAGELRREDWLSRVARARIFVSAARYEDWGIAQLEALASGTPLVTVPTPGPNEALALARRLAPRLVAPTSTAEALAAAIEEGLSLSDSGRLAYAEAADSLLEPYRPEAVQQVVTQAVVPELLRSSA